MNRYHATPIAEPLEVPVRPADQPTKRIGVNLDLDRYRRFRLFATENGLTGEQAAIIAIDRLLSGR
jgi:hypothetical protein